jgi:hypothetical protein
MATRDGKYSLDEGLTERERGQPALCSKTLWTVGLLVVGCVLSAASARKEMQLHHPPQQNRWLYRWAASGKLLLGEVKRIRAEIL